MSAVELITNFYQRSRTSIASRRTEKQMHVIETLSLGGKRQLVLVACGEQRFLIGTGGDSVQTIVEAGKSCEG